MQLISKSNKGIQFLLYLIDIFLINTHGLFLWKTKKLLQLQYFSKILDESDLKPNKMWVDKGSEFLQ